VISFTTDRGRSDACADRSDAEGMKDGVATLFLLSGNLVPVLGNLVTIIVVETVETDRNG
jgi:hypothetical protein